MVMSTGRAIGRGLGSDLVIKKLDLFAANDRNAPEFSRKYPRYFHFDYHPIT